jgi:nitroimidazol reductase NimA-like FMN-containing flavoprotein (pyridoxamine 5'-phosphate oxidase superfamily)
VPPRHATAPPVQAKLEDLTRTECMANLRRQEVGRVAIPLPNAAPLVVPVNYVMDGDVVVFRSDPGAKLDAIERGPVSFEVDEVDRVTRTGWSVLVTGTAHVADPDEVDDLRLEAWVAGTKDHWVRIVPSSITGCRISLPVFVPNPSAYL